MAQVERVSEPAPVKRTGGHFTSNLCCGCPRGTEVCQGLVMSELW